MTTLRPRTSGGLGPLVLVGSLLAGCAGAPRPPAVVSSQGEAVELACSTPSANLFEMVAELEVSDVQKETDLAEQSARAELRNKAAELGASLVTIDEATGERVLFRDAVRVRVTGRAFRAR